jgi:3-oxoacyl-[acyl-carrier-protein] synthase-3
MVACTASPEYHLPAQVGFVQDRLGLQRCATIEVRSGCAGAVAALDIARMYLERGDYKTAVVVGSEAISPLLGPGLPGQGARWSADAGPDGTLQLRRRRRRHGAAGRRGRRGHPGLGDGVHGRRQEAGDAGGRRQHPRSAPQAIGGSRLVELRVDVVESAKFTPHVLTEALAEVCRRSGVSAESIDLCVIPEETPATSPKSSRRPGC